MQSDNIFLAGIMCAHRDQTIFFMRNPSGKSEKLRLKKLEKKFKNELKKTIKKNNKKKEIRDE